MTSVRDYLVPRVAEVELSAVAMAALQATDYNDRDGYDPKFLGAGKALRVPLPLPVDLKTPGVEQGVLVLIVPDRMGNR